MKLRPLSFTRCAPSPLRCVGLGACRRRTVLVALRRDAAGRELLTWALVKAAAAGDRVVALHVSTANACTTATDGEMAAKEKVRANDSLASVLGAYKGFCDRNQIDLELKLCEGPSIKRALVAEATTSGAAHLILGVTKSSRPSGSSATAVARYCAKRVPPSCMVTAVRNGAVVYRRDAVQQQQQLLLLSPYNAMVETPRRLYRKILDARMTTGAKSQDDMLIGDGRSLRRNMSVAMSALVSPRVTLAPGPVRCHGQESPKMAAGWPLLKKDSMPTLPESSEISVVQWAMQLPTRCSEVSPVDSDKISDEQEEEKQLPQELVSLREKYSSKYTMFSYRELAKMTNGFSPERLVGKGGAGRVYRGCTEEGKELAVKVLKPSDDVMKDFISEIDILSSVEHKNAMSLVGFCLDGARLMLVYDYMPRGSLEEMLHGEKQGKGALGWPERFKVAVGVARALESLHGGGDHSPVIHRDIKSSNILVADDFEPKLCDFGLAMWADDAAAQVTGDDVAGTFGYLAPEYFMHGKVSDKLDVYAFGVVLLELISGRKPVSTGGPKGKRSLVMWANSIIQGGKLMDLVDQNLPLADGDADEVERMALAAALCIRRAHQHRSSMSDVVKLLAGDGDAVSWAKSQVGVPGDNDRHDECGVVTSPDKNDIQSYINLALRDIIDDDASSVGSADFIGANMSLEEYLKGRWSRSSSFEG
ncbi:Proline-rich receptor-like protein kinase PERK13 [Dichanthelium oligosanthes]|uniref:Proline-rich receptor-like protein kinase PERK13 n=1 Tax=Dichanthelium oligosanthes TaxID=888268 RepID=A0A1E5UTK2_9POAL|nr:Proline-rich receptor-like protein kinase PERK13 [Dichanthelium oligosanthes]